MKLVIYSGGDNSENTKLDLEVIRLTGKIASDIKITFIPSKSAGAEKYFDEIVEYYNNVGINEVNYFASDRTFSPAEAKEALESDVIYLSGGNTFYFLWQLKRYGFFDQLRKFVEKGGVLAGASAGSLLMTPSIYTAGLPSFDCDENKVGITDLTGLNLVNFEFWPHYVKNETADLEMLDYSESSKYPIYACRDGSGIVVEKDGIKFLGEVWKFSQGKKVKLFLG